MFCLLLFFVSVDCLVITLKVIKVLTTTASTAEAGKRYGIPASTIQPYVNRAKKAMEERGIAQIVRKSSFADSTGSSPGIATEDEIKEAVIENGGSHSEARKEQLFAAVTAAVSGKVTIKEACHQVDLPPSTAHPYVSKARHLLGSRCPDRKGIPPVEQVKEAPKSSVVSLKKKAKTENDEVPLSVRGVSRMLCDTKFDVFATDFKGTKEDLKAKIGKIIQRYNYKGNRDIMCDAIAKVFLEGRTLADVCASHSLAQTTLSTYVRLMKVHIIKEIEKENEDVSGAPGNTVHDGKEGTPVNVSAKLLKVRELDHEVAHSSNSTEEARETFDSTVTDEDGTELLQNVDVMVLHSKSVIESQERLLKLTIAYLIKQQYRRSPDAQEKMRICLEDVLLDGLSVSETLKIHKGPTDHVLQVYLARVRGAQKCITVEYPIFLEEKSKCVRKCDFSRLIQDKLKNSATGRPSRKSNSLTSNITPFSSSRRGTKRSQQFEEDEFVGPSDCVSYLNTLLTDVTLKAMMTYLSKLHVINFPMDMSLLTGLAKAVYEEVPPQYRHPISEETWEDWVVSWRKKHAIFDE
ncbi:unnamed protein product [Enterobius vermicularis]|uniref:HTH psq-type domain-containing protein n=1 Tax=Enterobius vermicularis TaxID=51028 RepID=A0A0N4V4I6_ENTVE|nr:unnamed protein product [Enterobius vermicularis]